MKCDRNKDGVISISELKEFIETQDNIDISEELAERIYYQFDTNKNEQIDFTEFVEMVNSPLFKNTFERLTRRICKFIVVIPNRKKALTLQRTLTTTGQYEASFKFQKSTVRILILSVLQICLFYINEAYKSEDREGPYYCYFAFLPCRKFEMYRYLTYCFVHSSEMHLYGNIFLQLLLGIPIEVIHKWRVFPIYFLGVLGGSLTHAVINREVGAIGASAGISAFLTIPIAAVILNWKEMSHPTVHLLLFGIITALDIVYKILVVGDMETSYASHLGGALVGLLFGVNILKNLKITKTEIIIWHISLVTLAIILIILVILGVYMGPNCESDSDYIGNCTYLYNY
ncbi:protein rhomboid isoform X2 [Leptinotarsa decemlineata]|uniref:protein rhomboid isoform X2 n=1 Tax=Leptinotarsa decemlineata TaxID=7539 RepID=UPI000C252088|nr:rhomboid-related protein 1-like isoform X2 [Leptinotarsa decemlineata]